MNEMMKLSASAVTSQVEYTTQLVSSLKALAFIVQEDKMCECGNGGCSACHTRDESPLHFIASGKEIEELYGTALDNDYPEDLWVDSGEMDLEGQASSTEGN
jgi:hypothetical protein